MLNKQQSGDFFANLNQIFDKVCASLSSLTRASSQTHSRLKAITDIGVSVPVAAVIGVAGSLCTLVRTL